MPSNETAKLAEERDWHRATLAPLVPEGLFAVGLFLSNFCEHKVAFHKIFEKRKSAANSSADSGNDSLLAQHHSACSGCAAMIVVVDVAATVRVYPLTTTDPSRLNRMMIKRIAPTTDTTATCAILSRSTSSTTSGLGLYGFVGTRDGKVKNFSHSSYIREWTCFCSTLSARMAPPTYAAVLSMRFNMQDQLLSSCVLVTSNAKGEVVAWDVTDGYEREQAEAEGTAGRNEPQLPRDSMTSPPIKHTTSPMQSSVLIYASKRKALGVKHVMADASQGRVVYADRHGSLFSSVVLYIKNLRGDQAEEPLKVRKACAKWAKGSEGPRPAAGRRSDRPSTDSSSRAGHLDPCHIYHRGGTSTVEAEGGSAPQVIQYASALATSQHLTAIALGRELYVVDYKSGARCVRILTAQNGNVVDVALRSPMGVAVTEDGCVYCFVYSALARSRVLGYTYTKSKAPVRQGTLCVDFDRMVAVVGAEDGKVDVVQFPASFKRRDDFDVYFPNQSLRQETVLRHMMAAQEDSGAHVGEHMTKYVLAKMSVPPGAEKYCANGFILF